MGKFPRKVKRWPCPICTEPYEDMIGAQECCPEEYEEEDWWQCVDCDEVYCDKEDAYSCCE